jgi:DNA-binding CsgD family transcriptional regulator
MTDRSDITEKDLRRILDAVDPERSGGAGAFVPDSFLAALPGIIGADSVTFQVMDPYQRTISVQELVPDEAGEDAPSDLVAMWWSAFWESCCYPQRSGDFRTIWQHGDALPLVHVGTRWLAFAEAARLRVGSHVIVPLAPRGTLDRRLILWRDSATRFTTRDVAILELLRPHLEILHHRHRQSQTTGAGATLTARQSEVLQLVSAGHSNTEIAALLVLSEATIRKHLENIYAKLGVSNRSAAVARAHVHDSGP